ncbi:MAG: nucleoside hydrolase [Armatimonadota bacterium]|nr:nucleoside hydrolase [Armatimonadota bacterium]MDR7485683.1 nucleoside hydrolase [Armatimonadota bacterium]MDR7533076.1 nucleoside hydrolase [Armatimonadota bacterium]MDR7535892.1 nucleoside hydrolase [Armatimonadota bacterium]
MAHGEPPAVLLDVDTGHDDAFAILLAARRLRVIGITTVCGNAPLERTTENTLKILEAAGLTDIPVAAGMARPLLSPPLHGPEIHGPSGLDGYDFPPPRLRPDRRHAVPFLIEEIRRHPGCWLIPTGPLTNIAVALREAPDLKDVLAGISLMGGSTEGGNVTPAAEYNIYADPEAAAVVFESGIPLWMAGLNLTRQALTTDDEVRRLRALGTLLGRVAADLLDFYNGTARRVFGRPGGYLHDPCAVAWLIDPAVVVFRPAHVAVELHGTLTRGATVCDLRHVTGTPDQIQALEGVRRGRPPNAQVGMHLDRARFLDLLLGALGEYP